MMNELTATVAEAKDIIREAMLADEPIWLHGDAGIGKSAAFAQVAEETGRTLFDIRVSDKSPEDFAGLPMKYEDPKTGEIEARFTRPALLPRLDPKKLGMLLYDELSDATRAVQSPLYQIILDRKSGNYELGKNIWPCAAGNRRTSKSNAQSISFALANRFTHIYVRPDLQCFLDWALGKGINPFIVAFLRMHKELLHNMDGTDGVRAPTPRGWVSAAKYVGVKDKNTRLHLLTGRLGETAAAQFNTFYELYPHVPQIDRILADPKNHPLPEATNPAVMWMTVSGLAAAAKPKTIGSIIVYAQRMGADYENACVLDCERVNKDVTDTKAFNDWKVGKKLAA